MSNHWADAFAQESERARSLAQRGMLLAGTSTVTAGVLLQSLGVLVGATVATSNARFTLLVALLSLVAAAIWGAIANATGPAESSRQQSMSDTQLAASLDAAQKRNERNTTALSRGAKAEVAGMFFLALTAVVYVFKW
jgi:hypothetical protein